MIYIGADHRGFELKEKIKTYLEELGVAFEDRGAFEYNEHDDFVDHAIAVAEGVAGDVENKGILICRNAVGMDIVANKIKGIRSAIGFDVEQIRLARNDDDINVLALASDFIGEEMSMALVSKFLDTTYEGHERQIRRLQKIKDLE